ncbi:MAG: LEA type 2 family protein [Planctomycetes bacterium]|nr:LEA type 2 family protein [Planctomycetota bacterium]
MFLLLFSVIFVFSTACSGFVDRRKELKNCDFAIKNARIENIGLTSLTLKLTVDIYNPNRIDVILDKLDVDIWINDNYVGKSVNEQKREIKIGTSENVELIFHIDYTGAYKIYKDIKKGEKPQYRFKGNVYFSTIFGDIAFPFEKKS